MTSVLDVPIGPLHILAPSTLWSRLVALKPCRGTGLAAAALGAAGVGMTEMTPCSAALCWSATCPWILGDKAAGSACVVVLAVSRVRDAAPVTRPARRQPPTARKLPPVHDAGGGGGIASSGTWPPLPLPLASCRCRSSCCSPDPPLLSLLAGLRRFEQSSSGTEPSVTSTCPRTTVSFEHGTSTWGGKSLGLGPPSQDLRPTRRLLHGAPSGEPFQRACTSCAAVGQRARAREPPRRPQVAKLSACRAPKPAQPAACGGA